MPNNNGITKSPKDVEDDFVALLNSCIEAQTGEWDPTGDDNEGFEAMHSILTGLARHFNVDISKAKEI